jgi:uncharacterized protein
MTFNDDSRLTGGKVKRRGRTAAVAGGGVGLAGIIALVITLLTGNGDIGALIGDGGGTTTIQGAGQDATPVAGCETGRDANLSIDCRMEGAAESLDTYWQAEAGRLGIANYRSPEFYLFDGTTSTACGTASASTGPFYCPPDRAIYLDTAFYDDLQSRFGASGGPLAQMYVVAHEWGHHIQQLQGTFADTDRSGSGAASGSVRVELQADCYAGAWVGAAATTKSANGKTFLAPITRSELADALDAAAAVGDDSIQKASSGHVDPDSFTHGSSAQRQRWFEQGYSQGAAHCDTFSVPASSL